jgi:Tol biopolymer transport system component
MQPGVEPEPAPDPEREQVKSIFFRASELPPADRAAFLSQACEGKPQLRSEVEDLLKYAEEDLCSPALLIKSFKPGQLIAGRFEVVRKVGEGGMGEVYEATDRQLSADHSTASGARLALKIIRPELSGTPGMESQFRRELMLSRRIAHNNVCKMFDLGRHQEPGEPDVLFLSMEFLSGITLAERLRQDALDRFMVFDLAGQLFTGLAEVHRHGIVHRDLKPGNIHLVPEGDQRFRLVVTDFGLARSLAAQGPTVTRLLAGTPGYTAPEQFETGECSVRADIYSLGAILYEMATGTRFDAATARQTLRRKAPEWADVILRCLERVPEKRPQQVKEVQTAFARPRRIRLTPAAWRVGWALTTAGAAIGLVWAMSQVLPRSTSAGMSEITQVTFDSGLTTEPAVAMDGRRMVYTSDRASSGVFSIWRLDLVDGVQAQLTRDDAHATTPAISADGKWVVYRSERGGGGVYLVSAEGGTEQLIAPDGRHPSFSPDGQRILYWTGQEGDYTLPTGRIWMVDRATRTRRQLHPDFADARFPVWSSEGDRILFRGSRNNTVDWSSANDWWVTDTNGISNPVATGAYDVLAGAGVTVHDSRIVWAPDRILFGGRKGHSTNPWILPVARKTARVTGEPRALTIATETAMAPWLLPGGAIAYSSKKSVGRILRVSLRTLQPDREPLVSDAALDTRPTISSDGTRLSFTRRLGEIRNVLVKDLITGEQSAVLREEPAVPFLSPDGKWLAYSMPLQQRNPVFTLSTSGGKREEVCKDCGEVAGWDRGGERLLFLTGAEGLVRGLSSLEIATGAQRVLLEAVRGLSEVSISSRGVAAFAVRSEGTRSTIFVAPVPAEGAIPSSPESWIPVTNEGWADKPRWSPDGTTLYFFSERDAFVCVWRRGMGTNGLRPARPEAVYHNHAGRHDLHNLSRTAQGLAVSLDSVVFNVPDISGNIWLIRTPEQQKTSLNSILRFFLPK